MTTRLYVDFRGGWHQMMEAELESEEVRVRMGQLADRALAQFIHQRSIRVTAVGDDGHVLMLDRDRWPAPDVRVCPHCGGAL